MKRARPSSPSGQHMRRWRERRGVSHLVLAAQAGTTPRHVSFLESGRSRPGREPVLRLAASLDVPLRERNALLSAAGLAPEFPALALSEEAMRPIADVVDRVLRAHDPYAAWVYTRGLRALAANRAGVHSLRRAEAHSQRTPRPERHAPANLPAVCPRSGIGGRIVRTVSTVLRFDTAVEVTASELRVELMFPADPAGGAFFLELAP